MSAEEPFYDREENRDRAITSIENAQKLRSALFSISMDSNSAYSNHVVLSTHAFERQPALLLGACLMLNKTLYCAMMSRQNVDLCHGIAISQGLANDNCQQYNT